MKHFVEFENSIQLFDDKFRRSLRDSLKRQHYIYIPNGVYSKTRISPRVVHSSPSVLSNATALLAGDFSTRRVSTLRLERSAAQRFAHRYARRARRNVERVHRRGRRAEFNNGGTKIWHADDKLRLPWKRCAFRCNKVTPRRRRFGLANC